MSRIIAMFAAITAGLETAAAVYDQVSTAYVPQSTPEVPPPAQPMGFVTPCVEA